MDRRTFLKASLATAVTATLPKMIYGDTDPYMLAVSQLSAHTHGNLLASGEIGRYEGFRFVETRRL